jgi:hypothetical protein
MRKNSPWRSRLALLMEGMIDLSYSRIDTLPIL